MAWDVVYTNEYQSWLDGLSAAEQAAVLVSLEILAEFGPLLGRPHADTVSGSRFKNMKELRTQAKGSPLRSFFAFDPNRTAVVLCGGDKTGDKQFYDRMIRIADSLYETHLSTL
jgi:hypothetical protein